MEKHFVTFYSPGTFVSETSELPVDSWNVEKSIELAKGVKERYGATPYGFRFTTRGRSEKDLDSKVVKESKFYWLGGTVYTAKEILDRNDPKEETLRFNIKANKYKKIIVNDNSWRFTASFEKDHVLLDVNMRVS